MLSHRFIGESILPTPSTQQDAFSQIISLLRHLSISVRKTIISFDQWNEVYNILLAQYAFTEEDKQKLLKDLIQKVREIEIVDTAVDWETYQREQSFIQKLFERAEAAGVINRSQCIHFQNILQGAKPDVYTNNNNDSNEGSFLFFSFP